MFSKSVFSFHIQIPINSQQINPLQPHGGVHIYRVRCSRLHMGLFRHTQLSVVALLVRLQVGYRARRRELRQLVQICVIQDRLEASHHSSIPTQNRRFGILISRRQQLLNFAAIQTCRRLMNARVPVAKVNLLESVTTILR